MEFKLTINEGPKSYKQVIKEPEANALVGLKLGDKIKGELIGIQGYEFMINGGSDNAGFPLSKSVNSADRKKVIKRLKNGSAIRKTIMGNVITESVTQVNLIVSKKGSKELKEYFIKEEPANQ